MKTIGSIEEMSLWSQRLHAEIPYSKIAFVPTMGSLHEGHLSLIRLALKYTKYVVVSIFVNPIQFNQKEDFHKYPRNIQKDKKLLENEKITVLFLPQEKEIFPYSKPNTQISIPSLSKYLCAAYRPGHFEGVLYIVHNLFSWVRPQLAFFGLKDYQQYLMVKR